MPRTRLAAEDRRELIVDAAFTILAAQGFEGLRTRDVAQQVNINSATLHYYFPTKEHLVAALAERLLERFTSEKAPPLRGKGALSELRRQFADVRFYQAKRPELIAVYRELAVRALRDPVTSTLVARLDSGWYQSVEGILQRGKDDGVFRSNLEPSVAAKAIVASLWGAVALLRLSPSALARMFDELEAGLVAKEQ